MEYRFVFAGRARTVPRVAAGGMLIWDWEAGMAYIVVVAGPHLGEMKNQHAGICTIGRGCIDAPDLNLGNDPEVSRPDTASDRPGHARVQRQHERWQLRDCGSLNKTWVVLWHPPKPEPGSFHDLAKGSLVALAQAMLFGCGNSSMLFLNIDEEPSTALRKALCRVDKLPPLHPTDHAGPTTMNMNTGTYPGTPGDRAAALGRWRWICGELREHHLGSLLEG
jgi:hypothetical protein